MKINQRGSIKKNEFFSRQKLLLSLILISMVPVFFATKSAFTVLTQTKDKKEKVTKKYSFKNEPIEFLQLQSNGKTVKADEKFIQEDDWLKDFTIKFKNISGKPITYVEIVLLFPETGLNGRPMSHPLRYGIHRLAKPNGRNKVELLASNETAEIKLSNESFTSLKNFLLSKSLLSDLTEVNFRIMTVHFADGSHWTAGTHWIPDPNSAGKFIAEDDNPPEEK